MKPRSAVLAIAAASIGLAGCSRHETGAMERAAVKVQVQRVAPVQLPSYVEGIGSVQSARDAVLAAKIMGTVLEIRKHAGESVHRGDILIVLDDRDVRGQSAQAEGALAQAVAAAALAETNQRRYEVLVARGSASQLEVDQAHFQYQTARGAVAQAEGAVAVARSYQSYARIIAPFDGRVVDRLCEVGDLASPGRPLLRIEDASHLRVDVWIDASRAVLAVPGGSVDVQVPALSTAVIRGTIAEVVPAADPRTRSTLVKIDLPPNPELRSGLYARALFRDGRREAIVVPRTALRTRGGLTGVFTVEDGRLSFRLVTITPASTDSVEVLSGLAAGDALVTSALAALEADAPAEVEE